MATEADGRFMNNRDENTWEFETRLLLETIFFRYKSDFREYSLSSVRRRLTLAIKKLGLESFSQLQDRLLSDPDCYDIVIHCLSVPTTEMFRDPGYFLSLRQNVIPILATYPSVKIWIAGCSTGEEAYSMAILLQEEKLLGRSLIYATDINPTSLRRAHAGLVRVDELQKNTVNYQRAGGKISFSDYYTTSEKGGFLRPDLLEKIVFADHSLTTDSVFAEVQLVSCRNVLIYFARSLQNKVFQLFFDALSPRGFLGIGAKETLRFSPSFERFEEFDSQCRIYRRRIA
jgi:chemotaxis protein methyltransferase CheR